MNMKVRFENADGISRMEHSAELKEVLINEDILHPDQESISLCFKGKNSSGIVDLTPQEVEMLYDAVKNRIHLIKGFKSLSASGAKML